MGLYKAKLNVFTGKLQLVPSGTVLTFKEAVADSDALPTDGNLVNEARVTLDNSHIWIWDGSQWVDQGALADISWDSLSGKPSSSPAQIDLAVTDSHTHSNKTLLDSYNQTNANITDAINKRHTAGSETQGGDISGTVGSANVDKLKGRNVPNPGSGDNGKFLKYDHMSNSYILDTANGGEGGAVDSVNGLTGEVLLYASDIPTDEEGKSVQDKIDEFTGGAVSSVNGETGDVILKAGDIETENSGETIQDSLNSKEDSANKSDDNTLGGVTPSTTLFPTQSAVRGYLDGFLSANDAMVFKGVIDCSGNPNYPAADAGDTYRVSVAGKIGGASGINVEVGDILMCVMDDSESGDQATVGSNWTIIQANIEGAVVAQAPFSSTTGNLPSYVDTTGRIIEDSGIASSAVSSAVSNSHAPGSDNQDASEVPTDESGVSVQDKLDSLDSDVTKSLISTITFIIDGGGETITTGIKGDLEIPFACEIESWVALADQSGSIQVDIWKDTYANFAPTNDDSITGSSNEVKITTGLKNTDSTLTGWTTSISAGDILRFNVDSVTDIQRVTISLKIRKV
jgi:hypothetical protein